MLATPVPVAAVTPAPVTRSELPRQGDTEKRSRPAHPGPLRIANAANTVTPGGTWSWQNPRPNGNSIYAISCTPGTTTCFAAGQNGPILNTTDGGAHWTQQQSVSGIFGLGCSSAQACTGVGVNGQVIFTTNGGTSWSTYQTGVTLNAISCLPAYCLAVGSGGRIIQINGASAVPKSSGTTADLFGISCTSSVCIAVGAGGIVAQSFNGGSFSSGATGTTATLLTVSCTASLCVAGGVGGAVAAGPPNVNQWGFNNIGQQLDFLGSSCLGNLCWMAADDGLLYAGAGLGWAPEDPTAPGALWSVSCADQSFCMTAGDFGFIAATSSGGTGWRKQSPNPGPKLTGISCATTQMCMAVGGNKIFVTTDNGSTWSDVSPAGSAADTFNGVACPTSSVCYVAGTPNLSGNFVGDLILATSNTGATWAVAQQTDFYPALNAVSCVPGTNACVAVGNGGLIVFSGTGGWPTAVSGTNTETFVSVTCVSTSSCMTVGVLQGGTTIRSSADRAHWTPILSTSNYLYGITCSTSTTCYAVGSGFPNMSILATTDGGATWQQRAPTGTGDVSPLLSVSCESASACIAVGQASTSVWSTTDGVTWTLEPPTPMAADTISCVPATTYCFAAGQYGTIARTIDGLRWLLVAPSGSLASGLSVSCPSATTCFAVDTRGVIATTNGGTTWQQVFADAFLTQIACASTTTCFATRWIDTLQSGYVVRTTDGGASWTTSSGFGRLTAAMCADATNCFMGDIGDLFIASTDGGATWAARAQVGSRGLSGIACPTATRCFVTDFASPGHVYGSTDGGAHWSLSFDVAADPQAGSTAPFHTIACASVNVCSAGGDGGLAATTTDGGATWRTDSVEASSTINSISCPTEDTCFATTNFHGILRSTDYGGSWLSQFGGLDLLGGGGGSSPIFTSVSCPSVTACFAVGYNGIISATTNGGVGWSKVQPGGQVTSIHSISCPDANNCYAGSFGFIAPSGIQVTHDGGATWTYHTLNKADIIQSISCPAVGTCFAVGWPGAIYKTTDGGTTWNYQATSLSGTDNTLVGISCPSVTTCYAVGNGGLVFATSDGSLWNFETAVTGLTLRGVSCISNTDCVAVGSGGVTLKRSNAGWTRYFTADSGTLDAVSCPATTKCYAVGASGKLVTSADFGVSWSAQSSGVTNTLLGIQCTSSTGCMAVGTGGTVIYTLDGATWSRTSASTFNTLRGVAFMSPGIAYVVGAGGTILKNPNLFFLCLTTTATSDKASPQFLGTSITFTGAAPGGCNARFEFWLLPPGGSWTVIQSYSASATYNWNTSGLAPGTYSIGVWGRDAASSNAFDSYTSATFALTTLTCTGAGISALPAPPVNPMTPVTFTATSTGCPNALYEIWMRPATSTTWQIVQPYSSSATFQWNSTYTSYVGVWAKDASSSTATFDANASMTMSVNQVACQNPPISASPNKITAGTGAHSTITASDICSNANPLFEFWMRPANSTNWQVVKPYSTSSTFDWDSTGSPVGTVYFGVWVKDAKSPTSTFDANAATSVMVSPPSCASVSGLANPTSVTHNSGTHSTITATPSGCTNTGPLYEFWVRAAGSTTWVLKQPYSTTSTFDWDSTGSAVGTVYIGIWLKDAASPTSTFDANAATTVTVT